MQKENNISLYGFIKYPNLALQLTLAPTYQWSGAPKVQRTQLMNLLCRFCFAFGALNVVYQNIGMIIYLFVDRGEKECEETECEMTKDAASRQLEALGQISETGGVMGLTLVACCKMSMLYLHEKRIRILLNEFEAIFPKRKQGAELKFYRLDHFDKQSQWLMKRTTIFFIFAFIYYNLLPILEFLYESLPGKEFQYRYQSNTWYPWQNVYNRKSKISFLAAYVCQVCSSLTGVAFIMGGEFLLCFFITQMQMHFEYLANALLELDAGSPGANERLRYLVNYHNRLLRYAKEINDIFNISFAVNFATSSIAICLMGFSMVMISVGHAFKYSVGLLSFLIFTLFICYNGSEFTDASDKIMPAAFYNNWYDGDRVYRKMILFFIMRSREPNYLRAYKFNTVSMETYMDILKLSYRLFTFFRALE